MKTGRTLRPRALLVALGTALCLGSLGWWLATVSIESAAGSPPARHVLCQPNATATATAATATATDVPPRARQAALERGKLHLSYAAQLGLCNQLLSHVNALTLAHAVGAELWMPPVWARSSFNHTMHDRTVWRQGIPLSTLLDLGAMSAAWQTRGLVLHEAQHSQPPAAWASCTRVPVNHAEAHTPLTAFAATARAAAEAAWQEHGQQACLVLDVGNMMFRLLQQGSTLSATTDTARTLAFPPNIEALAARAAAGAGRADGTLSAVHLRVEPDIGHPFEEWIPGYVEAMSRHGFNASTPCYVASGVLSYNGTADLARVTQLLVGAGVCSRLVVKEALLPTLELAALHSEQLALLDLLVLSAAARLVGHGVSTFSYVARDLRLLRLGSEAAAPTAELLPHPELGPGGLDSWSRMV